ncbi:CLUMA_CG010744, isoform A [Clunio marinus]|uniref:CLUMA_CG010744, isoform A n=1 Tax=Clunio marinus TaxID=568069 RepID=A0A1J1IFX6_9DIPT|nr:CLUMA_CG010744, isoform A [Clunio marinus]
MKNANESTSSMRKAVHFVTENEIPGKLCLLSETSKRLQLEFSVIHRNDDDDDNIQARVEQKHIHVDLITANKANSIFKQWTFCEIISLSTPCQCPLLHLKY